MKSFLIMSRLLAAMVLLLFGNSLVRGQAPEAGKSEFYLHEGDQVVFYGDSITEQRYYTTDIEEFAVTRFPSTQFSFFNGGVGGDRVSGGWTGPVDQRLHRDVFANHATVVTIMLGMNDGMYRAYDAEIFESYAKGYRYITEQILGNETKTRVTLIQPSPHDDVTRPPEFGEGYNAVLVKYGEFVKELGREKNVLVTDFNQPVVEVLTKAKKDDAGLSTLLIGDRVHPGAAVHWVMAEALLKTWRAPSVVTRVVLEGAKLGVTEQTNTTVTELRRAGAAITWTQLDRALPLPLPAKELDPGIGTIFADTDFIDGLDREDLRISGLAAGNYEFRIDERMMGTFKAEELAKGINLALVETPMLQQARIVGMDTELRNKLESDYVNLIRQTMTDIQSEAAQKLGVAMQVAAQKQRADAMPVLHRYSVTAAGGGKAGKS